MALTTKPQCTQLIFLPFTIALPQFAPLSVKDRTRHAMTTFAAVRIWSGYAGDSFHHRYRPTLFIQRLGNAP